MPRLQGFAAQKPTTGRGSFACLAKAAEASEAIAKSRALEHGFEP
jgi:hypothetical protein